MTSGGEGLWISRRVLQFCKVQGIHLLAEDECALCVSLVSNGRRGNQIIVTVMSVCVLCFSVFNASLGKKMCPQLCQCGRNKIHHCYWRLLADSIVVKLICWWGTMPSLIVLLDLLSQHFASCGLNNMWKTPLDVLSLTSLPSHHDPERSYWYY